MTLTRFSDVLYSDCLGMKIGDGDSFMQEQGLMKIVVFGGAILHIKRGFVIGVGRVVVIGVERASSGALLFSMGQGVTSARRSGIALQSGVLSLLLGSGGTCQGVSPGLLAGGHTGAQQRLHQPRRRRPFPWHQTPGLRPGV